MNTGATVADVMAFARSGGVRQYDEIAARVCASSPFTGASPLHTVAGETRHQPTPDALKRGRLKGLREAARPLSFDPELPPGGRVAYEFTRDLIRLRLHHEERTVVRRMSLGHPMPLFLKASSPDPAARLLGQQVQIKGEAQADIWWLPFLALVEQGRFVRMQECDRLTKQLEPNAFYLSVSHRWLDLADPDPEGGQAAAVAWQFVGDVIEAIWVHAARGTRGARLRSDAGHAVVGPHGSDLAESIVVNLLASADEDDFGELLSEAQAFDDIEGDRGVRHAREDIGLAKLRAQLAQTPALQGLLSSVRLWYDFNCMPQYPRTAVEQAQFEFLLQRLGLVQMLGRTAVLLDDIADYFGRGWCSYEATLAFGYLSSALDVWSGGRGPTVRLEPAEDAFMRVLKDRPHILWRAILDTELFGVQTGAECMTRLGLATTRPEDRGIVYDLLRGLGVPRSIHFDDGEILTGVFPMPVVNGKATVRSESGRRVDAVRESEERDIEMSVVTAKVPALGVGGLPAWVDFEDQPDDRAPGARPRTAHVAVVGSCEGEAILFAHWVREHRQALQEALQVRIVSLSWLASDVAPVGHFALNTLSVRPVQRDSWIVVATDASLVAGSTTLLLIETLWTAGIDHAELGVGATGGTLKVYAKGDMATATNKGLANELLRFDIDDPKLRFDGGGAFRLQFMQQLGIQT